jgi:hypothetical protein
MSSAEIASYKPGTDAHDAHLDYFRIATIHELIGDSVIAS